MNWRNKPVPSNAPFICNNSAYIIQKEYEVPNLTSTSDLEFHSWAADLAKKYPVLKLAYHDLYECVTKHHPEVKKGEPR